MNRRDFLKITGPTSLTVPLIINGIPAYAMKAMDLPPECSVVADRVLVLIQLRGGNDGLNTTVPLNQYDTYANYRTTTRINDVGSNNGALLLDSTLPEEQRIGLHPSLVGFKDLYDRGLLNVVQMVGYEQHNLSHFKSTDLMMVGGDGTQPVEGDGWMADYLTYTFPGTAGNPSAEYPDPIGIQLGDLKPSLGFHSTEEHGVSINLARQDPNGYFSLLNSLGGLPPETIPSGDYGEQLQFIVDEKANAEVYSERIADVFNAGANSAAVTYPNTYLANQMKTVARLLSGGSKTKVFLVDLTGFDTHVNQVQEGTSHLGSHSDLLSQLGDAVQAFQNDLAAIGIDEKVLTVTFSEFGRKAIQNNNLGTDHGNYAPMFVVGRYAKPGVTGVNPDLTQVNMNTGRFFDDQIQHDYRQVYTTALQDWLGTDDSGLEAVDFAAFQTQKLDIIEEDQVVTPDCYIGQAVLPVKLTLFDAEVINPSLVRIFWQTASESGSSHFNVERSINNNEFTTIGRVEAAGDSSNLLDYEFFDEEPVSGISYYRLKSIDLDGSFENSDIVMVQIDVLRNATLSPNPVRFSSFYTFTAEASGNIEFTVVDLNGRVMNNFSELIEAGFNKIEIDFTSLANGLYVLNVSVFDRQGSMKLQNTNIKFVKQ